MSIHSYRYRAPLVSAVVFVAVTVSLALTSQQADALADHVLASCGRSSGGVAVSGNCGDGALAVSLIAKSAMWVHAVSDNGADVGSARTALNATGKLGRRAFVERVARAQIPYADNFIDLVVVTGLTDATLSGLACAEVLRALSPGGTAFIGRAGAEGAGLSAGALQSWAGGNAGVSVTTDALGTWAVVVKPFPSGRDVWSHTTHGPDNNPVSSDLNVKWPFLPQWRQYPAGCDRYGGLVTGGGRAYLAINQSGKFLLRAYRITNGQVLWSSVLANNNSSPVGGSFMVATSSGVYAQVANTVVFYAGETGQQSTPISFASGSTRSIKGIYLIGNLLYALVGEISADVGQEKFGDEIAAYNLSTSQFAWRNTYTGKRIESREIGIADGKVFFYVRGERVVAVNASSGAQVWEHTTPSTIALLESDGNLGWSWTTYPASGFLCSPYGVFICSPGDDKQVALSAVNGSFLWSATKDWWGRMTPKLLMGTTLVNKFVTPVDRRLVDVTTGLSTTQFSSLEMGGGCGVRTASPDGIFGNAGGQASSVSLNRNIQDQNLKTDCGIGAVLSDGMELYAATGCQCSPLRGTIVNSSANGFVFGSSAVQSQRLETGPAHGSLVKQAVPTNQDWWTHRGGANRTGASSVSLPMSPSLKCSYTPAHRYDTTFAAYADQPELQPTPPVSVGNLVIWGGSDGYVRCFSTQSGLIQWEYPTGAAIRATPTVWDGCVYVGSSDGYAYCLEAHTGRLVWRFRGAPVERRINLYGQLSSTWPVNTGLTVSGDTVYFAAGYRDNFGTHVYALHAKTGAIIWQNNTAGAFYVAQDYTGITPGGYGLMVRGNYWLKALAFGRNGIFNGATGALAPLATTPSLGTTGGPNNNGQELALLDNNHVIYGGAWWWMDKQDQGLSDRKRSFSVHTLDAQGNVLYPEVTIPANSIIAPAWDNDVFVVEVKSGHASTGAWLEKWSMSGMVSTIESLRSANAAAKEVTFNQPAFASTARTSLAQWSSNRTYAHAIALAPNAVAVLSAAASGAMSSWRWYLSFLSRTTGDTLWQTQIPSMPVRNGIAIDRAGNVIVSLYSGAVLCYGEGSVNVASRAIEQPAALELVSSENTVGWTALLSQSQTVAVRPVVAAADGTEKVAFAAVTPRRVAYAIDAESPATPPSDPVAACHLSAEDFAVTHPGSNPDRHERRDMTWLSERACLPIAAVRSSSGDPGATIDYDLRTRWTVDCARGDWVQYDLGQMREISGVSLVWYSRETVSTPVVIEVSSNGSDFEQVDRLDVSGRATNTALCSFLPREARYVRVSFVPGEIGEDVRLSLYETGVHGAQ